MPHSFFSYIYATIIRVSIHLIPILNKSKVIRIAPIFDIRKQRCRRTCKIVSRFISVVLGVLAYWGQEDIYATWSSMKRYQTQGEIFGTGETAGTVAGTKSLIHRPPIPQCPEKEYLGQEDTRGLITRLSRRNLSNQKTSETRQRSWSKVFIEARSRNGKCSVEMESAQQRALGLQIQGFHTQPWESICVLHPEVTLVENVDTLFSMHPEQAREPDTETLNIILLFSKGKL